MYLTTLNSPRVGSCYTSTYQAACARATTKLPIITQQTTDDQEYIRLSIYLWYQNGSFPFLNSH